MDAVVQELVGYIPSDHIEESWYDPEEDQTGPTMFCSADLDGVSDYIRIIRGGLMWADDTVDVVEVAKQIEADYSAKPGWIVTRPKEGYSGPEITVRSPEHYIFNVNIDAETGYFAIGAWSPCFPAPRAQRSRQVLNAEGSRRSTINTLITTKKQRVRSNTQTFILIGVIATLALSGCTESQKESYVAPASTLTEAPSFMDAVVQELIGYVPAGHIDDSRYDPDDDQTSTAMFCSSDLDGVSDYITIMRSASLWTDDTVDLVEVAKQIEADYSAKPGWSVTRPKEGYSGPEITVHSPERYMFNIGIRPDSNYFSIGGWSPCFPAPPEHSGIDKY